jgi:formylglycine-generating enzyme required for sulfatase activity
MVQENDMLGRSLLLLTCTLMASAADAAASGAQTVPIQYDRIRGAKHDASRPDVEALRLAIQDLSERFSKQYAQGDSLLARLDSLAGQPQGPEREAALSALRREALLANPLLDFDELLLVDRRHIASGSRLIYYKRMAAEMGLPVNFNGNSDLPRKGYDDRIAIMKDFRSTPTLRELYRPPTDVLVADLELHWSGEKLLFSSLDETGRWHIFEIGVDGSGLRRVTPERFNELEVDSYDACYLADDRIMFTSTVTGQAVPCTGGSDEIANICRMNADGTDIRRLTFDQDQNYGPTMTEQGTVIFSRWQYTDQPHRYGRPLLQMNPDGTGLREFYGSSSYWPNAIFYARPIPGQPNKFVSTIGGHHGVPRMGEMILFDISLGRRQGVEPDQTAVGVVQRITDRGKRVKAVMGDKIVDNSWPKFLHPYPLDEHYFLVSAQPTEKHHWGIYLVDVFDNMVLLHEQPGQLLLEPFPIRPIERPPVIPDRVDYSKKDAQLYISDIYQGPGLEGVPRGSVKELRIFSYNYPPSYKGKRGNVSSCNAVTISGGWDIREVWGTVPVDADGSAYFKVPANIPLSLQPLDAEGKAMQLMRSWLTAMPGENLACIGCHEDMDLTPPKSVQTAFTREPSHIESWLGETRPFDFRHEVQPVIEKRCIGCHDGPDRPHKPKLSGSFVDDSIKQDGIIWGKRSRVYPQDFTWSYYNLQRYVYRPTGEAEMAVLDPMEYHADTSQLVQMLQKGHHGVELDAEDWQRLIMWIDLNVPFYGEWEDAPRVEGSQESLAKRREYLKLFAQVDWDLHELPPLPEMPAFVQPAPPADPPAPPELAGWPLSEAEALALQSEERSETRKRISFGKKGALELVWVPAGSFVMGDNYETAMERPMAPVAIDQGYWMSSTEIDNQTYHLFDPAHHSRYFIAANETLEPRRWENLNEDRRPVVRISWQEAQAFCDWLSAETGLSVSLPSEAQWEWACRAGSAETFPAWSEGAVKDLANCAGLSFGQFYEGKTISHRLFDWEWDDGVATTEQVGNNIANRWGLHDMHGNVAEWTRSLYLPYPYQADDGRNDLQATGKRVVRGGSFADRPKRSTVSYRLGYQPWQGVYNVGFRIVIEDDESVATR